MDASDLDLRRLTYEMFVELGRAPGAAEVAFAASVDVAAVEEG